MNLVAQFGGPFVIFGCDRLFHLAAQTDQLRLLGTALDGMLGALADVFRFAVNIDQ